MQTLHRTSFKPSTLKAHSRSRCSSVVVHAASEAAQQRVPLPKGVSLPPRVPVSPPALFGFVANAELLNSRAAMLGFFALLLVEGICGKGLLELAGFATGKGLGFEF